MNRPVNRYGRLFLLAAWAGAAFCALTGSGSAATAYYITPSGSGDGGGTNWANAFSNVQAAATLATNAGDAIYLQWGVYSNASQIVISNAAELTIYGGCNGSGANSNDYSGTNSILTRTGGVMRIVYGYVSTVTVAGVTVSGGYFTNGANNGAGMCFTNCGVTLTNCVVRNNTNVCTTAAAYGGGVYANGGSLTIFDSAFNSNTLQGIVGVYGGGIAAVNCPLSVRGSGSVFSNNAATATASYAPACGGAIYATNGAMTLDGARLIGNILSTLSIGLNYGGAVYHAGSGMSATIAGCQFAANSIPGSVFQAQGGAVCLAGATGSIAGCTFTNNNITGLYSLYGGGVYASGLQSLQVVSNEFQGNWLLPANQNPPSFGAALCVNASSNARVECCVFDGGGVLAGTAPELVYITNGNSTVILDSTLRNNSAGKGLSFVGGASSALRMTNCLVANNGNDGLYVAAGTATVVNCTVMSNISYGINWAAGTLAMTNCLVAKNISDGLLFSVGTATVANCTFADNGGWGFNRSDGTGTVVNSIAWGNGSGGYTSNANLSVNYSCSQTAPYGGTSNILSDPLFVNAPGYYYLSVQGLTNQPTNSPCIDAGSNTAEYWGLTNRTTRTDNSNDTGIVDLGYHYTNGLDDSHILPPAPTVCYVDAVHGTNANNGQTWEAAWKTLTKALATVAQNATINVATGAYNAANGETFPLTVQKVNVSIIASNSSPALTVLDNRGTAGANVFSASGKGNITLQGLTFSGGCFTNGANNGGGLYFLNCGVVILTNCVVRDNTNVCTTAAAYGGGVYANGGSLTIFDSAFNNNILRGTVGVYGGGIAAVNCPLSVRGSGSVCVFSNNSSTGTTMSASAYGGAIYANGATLALAGARLIGNMLSTDGNGYHYGGAVYHAGSGMSATIAGCWFAANSLQGSVAQAQGGAVCLAGATGSIAGCTFTNNHNSGLYQLYGGGVYASGLQSLQVASNEFQGNWLLPANQNPPSFGAALCVNACSNARVECCVFDGGGVLAGRAPELLYITNGNSTVILDSTLRNNSAGKGLSFVGGAGSALGMTNCLIVNNGSDGLRIAGGTATVVNCTLANNTGWGIARPTSAGLTVKNSIFWGNMFGGIGHNQNLVLTYTDAQDGWAAGLGAGNFSADPLFVDTGAGDYHLASTAGSWHGGLWMPDLRMSPCIDAGDPASPYALEPKPNRGRVNLGAYGNTVQASLSSRGTVISIR